MDSSLMQFDFLWTLASCAASSMLIWLCGLIVARADRRTPPAYRYNALIAICVALLLLPIAQHGMRQWEMGIVSPDAPAFHTLGRVVGLVWIMGSVLMAIRLSLGFLWIWRNRSKFVPTADDRLRALLAQATAHVGVQRPVEISAPESNLCPIVIGFFKPVVVIPGSLCERLSDKQLLCVLIHECEHIRRGDVVSTAIHELARCLYWWNPFCHWAGRELERLRERACDDRVSELPGGRETYLASLLRVAEWSTRADRHPRVSLALFNGHHDLVSRIRRLGTQNDTDRNVQATGGFLASAAFVLLVAATASVPLFGSKAVSTATTTGTAPTTSGETITNNGVRPAERLPAATRELLAEEKLTYVYFHEANQMQGDKLVNIISAHTDKSRGVIVDLRRGSHSPETMSTIFSPASLLVSTQSVDAAVTNAAAGAPGEGAVLRDDDTEAVPSVVLLVDNESEASFLAQSFFDQDVVILSCDGDAFERAVMGHSETRLKPPTDRPLQLAIDMLSHA